MRQQYEYPKCDHTKLTDRVLSKKEVVSLTGLSKSTVYAYIQKGIFPAQIRLGFKRVGWLESELMDWISKRKIQSRSGASND
jgi:prophage regulatory protein